MNPLKHEKRRISPTRVRPQATRTNGESQEMADDEAEHESAGGGREASNAS
jgi:hypothetical protein